MADVTGPISTLPGAVRVPPQGQTCDDHPTRLAVKRVQGETDSMGSEMFDMCEECFTKHSQELAAAEPEPAFCGGCSRLEVLGPLRDPDEGSCGPVYYRCFECRVKFQKAWNKANPPEDFSYDDFDYDETDY